MPLGSTPIVPGLQHHTDISTELVELLTVTDLAALLKVSKSWVYEHTRSRDRPLSDRLPHVKIGKYIRFDPDLVRAFLNQQTAR